MELVVDANILFASFIKNGVTRRILLTKTPYPLRLYTSPFILQEAYKYHKLLSKKTGLDEDTIMDLILELLSASAIEILSETELEKFRDESERVSPTKNDAPYFAAALYKSCDIWSNDKPIRRQNKVRVLSTLELLEEI